MYIVAIGWAYVILMVAITASSIGKAVAILLFLGVLPLALFVYAFGRPKRRRSVAFPDEVTGQRDGSDSQSD
jgi:Flp pilus assembly protein TadB